MRVQIFCLILSYPSNRSLRLVVDGKSSQEYPVNAGVTQDSIFDTSLSLFYINDLPIDVICKILICADRTRVKC